MALRVTLVTLLFGVTQVSYAAVLHAESDQNISHALAFVAKHADSGPMSPMNWALEDQLKSSARLLKNRDRMANLLRSSESHAARFAILRLKSNLSREGRVLGSELRLEEITPNLDSDSAALVQKGQAHVVLRMDEEQFVLASSFGADWFDYYGGSHGAGDVIISVGYRLDKLEDPMAIDKALMPVVREAMTQVSQESFEAMVDQRTQSYPHMNRLSSFVRNNLRFFYNFGIRDFLSEHKAFLAKAANLAKVEDWEKFIKSPSLGYFMASDGNEYFVQSFSLSSGVVGTQAALGFVQALSQVPKPAKIYVSMGPSARCDNHLLRAN